MSGRNPVLPTITGANLLLPTHTGCCNEETRDNLYAGSFNGSADGLAGAHGGSLKTVSSAVAMLCCLSLGVGVFAMPTVISQVGWVVGLGLILFFGFLSTSLMLFALSVIESHHTDNWDSLVGLIPSGLLFSRISLAAALITGNAGHLQLVSGMLFDLMSYFVSGKYGEFGYDTAHRVVVLLLLLGIALPYTFGDDLGALRHVGKAVSGVVLTSCIVVGVNALVGVASAPVPSGLDATPVWPKDAQSVFQGMSTIAFAFTSMFSLFETLHAMRRGSPTDYMPKMRSATKWAGFLVTLIYLVVCCTCNWAFGLQAGENNRGNGSGNVLYNFPPSNYPVTVLCFFLVIVIVLDYPIIIYPVANMFMDVTKTKSPLSRPIINVALAVLVILVVVFVPDLTDVFGLCGSLGVSVFCYLLPGLVCLRFHPSAGAKLVSFVAVVAGLTMLILSTFFIMKHVFSQ